MSRSYRAITKKYWTGRGGTVMIREHFLRKTADGGTEAQLHVSSLECRRNAILRRFRNLGRCETNLLSR
jgi:hypothetical protein